MDDPADLSLRPEPREGRRMSRAEVESRLMDTALAVIKREGLTVGLDHIRVDQLMLAASVPKTSFYRVWDTKDEFLGALLTKALERNSGAFDEVTLDVARNVVFSNQAMIEQDPEHGPRRVFLEAIRLGAKRNFEALTDPLDKASVEWRTYTTVLAAMQSLPAERPLRKQIEEILRRSEDAFLGRLAALYDQLVPGVRYRFKPGADAMTLAASGAAVVEGLVQRSLVKPELVARPVPGPSITGGTTDWHLAAVGFRGVAEQMAEPVFAPRR